MTKRGGRQKVGFVRDIKIESARPVHKLHAVEGDGRRWDTHPKPPAPGVSAGDLATLLTLYTADPWIYAAATVTARAVTAVRRIYYKQDPKTKKWERSEDTLLEKLLEKPNQYQVWEDLCEMTVIDLRVLGWSWWEKSLDEEGVPNGIWRLRPDRVEIDADPEQYWTGINFKRDEKGSVHIEPDELVPFRHWSPISDYWPVSGLFASQTSVIWDLYARAWNSSVFKNGAAGLPEGVFETDQKLTPQQHDRIVKGIQQKLGHPDVWRSILLLDNGLKFRATQRSENDMQFTGLMDRSRDEKLATMGTPPAMVGIAVPGGSTGFREQRMLFYQVTVLPLLKKLQSTINRFLAPVGEEMEFDLQDILSLIEDLESRTRTAEGLVTRGIQTINEVRSEIGLKPVPWGDQWYAPLGLAPVDATGRPVRPDGLQPPPGTTGAPGTTPPPAAPETKPADVTIQSDATPENLEDYDARRSMIAAGQKNVRPKLARSFAGAYRRLFGSLKDKIEGYFKGKVEKADPVEKVQKAEAPQFDWSEEDLEPVDEDEYLDLVRRFVGPTALEQTNKAAKLMARGFGVDFKPISEKDPNFRKVVDEWLDKRARSTSQTLNDRLRDKAQGYRREGLTARKTIDNILRDFDALVDERIADLSHSDSTTFGNTGTLVAGADYYTHKQWVDLDDGKVRNRPGAETHIAKNFPGGDIVPLDGKFKVPGRGATYEMDYPGDPAGGPEVTSYCRCGMMLLTAEEARALGAPE